MSTGLAQVAGIRNEMYIKNEWTGSPLDKRLWYLTNDMIVPHPQIVRFIKQVIRRSHRCQITGRGECIALFAETGSGKSFLVRYFDALMPNVEHEHWSERPMVDIDVPAMPSSISMSEAYLERIGCAEPGTGKAGARERRCATLAKACRTQLSFVDNMHRVPERRVLGVREVGDWLCHLTDRAPLLLAILGASPARQILIDNEQLRRRSITTYNIDYFNVSTLPNARRYARFLCQFDLCLPLAELCGLGDKDTLVRMLCATYGIPALHIDLFKEVLQIANENGLEKVGHPELALAYAAMVGDGNAGPNPFDPNFTPRLLTEPGELFHAWLAKAQGRKKAA